MLELILIAVAGIGGFATSRDFVRRKLRFVDAAHSGAAPWVAAGTAVVVAAPVVAILPIVGAATALALGVGVGVGVRSAQRDRHLLP